MLAKVKKSLDRLLENIKAPHRKPRKNNEKKTFLTAMDAYKNCVDYDGIQNKCDSWSFSLWQSFLKTENDDDTHINDHTNRG